MKKNIELISLIYKSVDYLKLIVNQLESQNCLADGWDVNYRIVANDANKGVIDYLETNNILHTIYNDPYPNDFYLNRVYRCWNFAGKTSKVENICFINSDMMFSPNWLTNLLKHHNGKNIPCSRLVESGKLRSGSYGIERNFGTNPKNIDQESFNSFASLTAKSEYKDGGLYMPCIFETETFISSGGYPEGNVFLSNNGELVVGYPNDRPVYLSGDSYFFKLLEATKGMKHVTVFDSIVYHIQEGEKDE